jgi:uncharacterized membrane-anchored protein
MFNPYITHPLTALLRFAIVFAIIFLTFTGYLGPIHAAIVGAALYTIGYYEGREAGQREHDLKHLVNAWNGFWAWLGSFIWFGWAKENIFQALAAIVPVIIAAVILWLLNP